MKVVLLKEVENSVANGEIARIEQFLLLPQCFQKSSPAETSESVCMGERVTLNYNVFSLYSGSPLEISTLKQL